MASLAILVAGATTIYLGRRRSGWRGVKESGGQIKVLNVRRVGGKLMIVVIETTEGERIAFADNGHALLLLTGHESTAPKKIDSSCP
ncbi:hypothetical protein [Nevskia soli]|uniref:hypothetical protein n=1 Tax=Nevskia soli TaxID=418856 RepID=UPI001470636C|nr:hypothetical protein [Nevskia soli]